jgi:hypothetical protein
LFSSRISRKDPIKYLDVCRCVIIGWKMAPI